MKYWTIVTPSEPPEWTPTRRMVESQNEYERRYVAAVTGRDPRRV